MNFSGWKWLNESSAEWKDGQLVILAHSETDWYNNPIPDENNCLEQPLSNAPFYYTEVTGDFVFRAKITPGFESFCDAGALMVIQDEQHWIKCAFEGISESGGAPVAA